MDTDSDAFRRYTGAVLVLAALLAAPRAEAADPQSYTVSLPHTGNEALDAALAATSQLESLRKATPVSPSALIGRAQADVGRLQTVLESFGYYQGKVGITLEGRPVNDPTLPEVLAALPSGTTASTSIVNMVNIVNPEKTPNCWKQIGGLAKSTALGGSARYSAIGDIHRSRKVSCR